MRHGAVSGSQHFADVIGVFEGGGVRGLAFAGAIDQAVQSGMRFQATLGTSAGAIAAALVASGAGAPQIVTAMMAVDFKTFRGKAVTNLRQKTGRVAASLLGETARTYGAAHFGLGRYSSLPIESWMNNALRDLTGKENACFRDLSMPIAILAADITTGLPRIWSTLKTPDESVAFAVRCSATIPFYFQPVEHGTRRLVDGGILANLPLELIEELPDDYKELATVAFRLVRGTSKNPGTQRSIDGAGALLDRVVDTALGGRTALTSKNGYSDAAVEIYTGETLATDFGISAEGKQGLVASGREAVAAFLPLRDDLARRALASRVRRDVSVVRKDNLVHTSHLFNEATQQLNIFAGNLSWFTSAFPSLALAMEERNVRVRVLVNSTSSFMESGVALDMLGCELGLVEGLAIRGSVLGLGEPETRREGALRGIIVPHGQGGVGRLLYREDTSLLKLLNDHFEDLWRGLEEVKKAGPLRTVDVPTDMVQSFLRTHVEAYSSASFEHCVLPIDECLPLSRHLEYLKIVRARAFTNLMHALRKPTFSTLWMPGFPFAFLPPIIEEHDNQHVVVDGHHRVALFRESKQPLMGFVVRGARPLPAQPQRSWDRIFPRSSKLPREERYTSYHAGAFRELKRAMEALAGDLSRTI